MTENERAARNKKIAHVIMWIVLLLLFICFIFPFILVVINVFKSKVDIVANPLSLIGTRKGFTLDNFPAAMEKMQFWKVFGNSLIITVTATILTILVSSMTAFVIVRNGRWKFCTLIFSLMIASMVIPFQVLMLPLVSIYGGMLNVLNHRITLILRRTSRWPWKKPRRLTGAAGGRPGGRSSSPCSSPPSRPSASSTPWLTGTTTCCRAWC